MKKNLFIRFFSLAFAFCYATNLGAQGITIVPNPTVSVGFSYTSSSAVNALSGYAGSPVQLGNMLVLEYNATGVSSTSTSTVTQQTVIQFATYTGGNALNLIPNPTNESTVLGVYQGAPEVDFNNQLYFIYLDTNQVQKLASFNGTSITLYPNPDASPVGYVGSPRILNNQLYVVYNSFGTFQFAKFTGTGLSLIPNPDASTVAFDNDYSVVFGNTIASRYVNTNGVHQLAIFNGTSWTLKPNPDNTTNGVVKQFPALYNNKLYFNYYSNTGQFQLMQYDGVNNPTLIANADDESANNGGYSGFPIVFDDTLFIQYQNMTGAGELAKFDGTTMTLVPNPDATTYGYYNTPIVYNNNLYIFYVTPDGLHHIGEYEAAKDSLKVYPNPDAGSGYWDQPIVYDNNLFFIYYNASGLSQLGYFNGTAINLVPNPSGAYSSGNGNNGYLGQPIIWNSLLYLQMASIGYANSGNLGFFDGSLLPVTLLDFTAQKNGNTSLLKWDVTNEVNNAYFTVERSSDGNNFLPVGNVTGDGSVSTRHSYQLTDYHPVNGVNFYRLKQVDYDGNFTYSNVVTVTFTNIVSNFNAFPNPANSMVTITLPLSTATSTLNVYDVSGKKVLEQQIRPNTASESLNVDRLVSGVYQLILKQGEQQQNIKLVKE